MRRLAVVTMGTLVLLLLGARVAPAQERTFSGLLSDEDLNCVQNPMKVPPGTEAPPWDKTSCVLYWAHHAKPDGKFVLYDPDKKITYKLDDQKLVEPYVGDTQKVKVTGTLDEPSNTIHVKKIQS